MSVQDQPESQHMRALTRANQVRLARAELKREIGDGRRTVVEVLEAVPWHAGSMTVSDLLLAQHLWGRTRVRRLLTSIPLSEAKLLAGLTDRQRRVLIARLKGEDVVDPWPFA
jgi:hypothetical protein